MIIEERYKKGILSFLKLDHSFFKMSIQGFREHILNYDFSYYFDIDRVGKENFIQIVFYCVKQGLFDYWIDHYDGEYTIYCMLKRDLNFKEISEKISKKEVFNHLKSQLKDKDYTILDGNYKDLKQEIIDTLINLFECVRNPSKDNVLRFVEYYKTETHIYNNLLIRAIHQYSLDNLIDHLNVDGETKDKIKADPKNIFNIFYDYNFLDFDIPIKYSGGHPFNYFIDGMFKVLMDGIKERDTIKFSNEAHNLKVISEIFMHSNLSEIIKIDIELRQKLDYVVNFSRWIGWGGELVNFFNQEYYLTSDLENELIEYVLFIKSYLINAISDLINYDLKEDRINVFETKLRYINSDRFNYRNLAERIKQDFEEEKSIEEIAKRRNPNISWKFEPNQNPYEGIVEKELKKSSIKYLRNINIGDGKSSAKSEFDFLISDGKNSLMSIECKSGNKASSTNELLLFSEKNKILKIINSKFIGFKREWNLDSEKNMINVSKLLNIHFEKREIKNEISNIRR